jgi:D-threo-aldose 1-dehydrogenase
VHDPENHLDVAINEAVPELERMRSEGLVGAIGVGSGNVGALVEFASRTNIDAVMVAGRYTLLEQPARPDLVPICLSRGISILNAGVFNSGLLASDHPATSATYEYSQAPSELISRARGLAELASEHNTRLPAAALQYAAQLPAVVAVVFGAETPNQVRENIENFVPRQDLSGLWSQL